MPRLTMLSAPSASGKSTWARQRMADDGNCVRINRDDLRLMAMNKWSGKKEGMIIKAELALCDVIAQEKRHIIIDDTNLRPEDETRWKAKALQLGYTFEKVTFDVPLEECVARDWLRGEGRIGRPAIERQFLRAGLWQVPPGVKTVIFDIDGTLGDLTHRVAWITVGATCPMCLGEGRFSVNANVDMDNNLVFETKPCTYCEATGIMQKKNHEEFYARVMDDTPIVAVIEWIQNCYQSGEYNVIIVTGRSPESCQFETMDWLDFCEIPYHHLLMRRSGIHGPDWEEKQLILDQILTVIPKEDIAFVVDDRPSVVEMWRRNHIRVFPVRGRDDDKFYQPLGDAEMETGK